MTSRPAFKNPAPGPDPVRVGELPAARCGLPPPLTAEEIDRVVRPALAEDLGQDVDSISVEGDVTTHHAVPVGTRAAGRLVCKGTGRVAGLDVFARVFELLDPSIRIERQAADGDRVEPGQVLMRLEGSARALLVGERTALNLVQRMSGTAAASARYVDRAGPVRVLDTRKTTPNLRTLEKYAVRCGGAENHRYGLFDEAMVKNNHLDLAGRGLVEVVRDLRRALGPGVRITAEARDEREALDGVVGGADVILLDNMSVEDMRSLCPRLREAAQRRGRPVEIEASGGITEETIGRVATSTVDRVSVGALTHSAPSLDLSLYLEPLAADGGAA